MRGGGEKEMVLPRERGEDRERNFPVKGGGDKENSPERGGKKSSSTKGINKRGFPRGDKNFLKG